MLLGAAGEIGISQGRAEFQGVAQLPAEIELPIIAAGGEHPVDCARLAQMNVDRARLAVFLDGPTEDPLQRPLDFRRCRRRDVQPVRRLSVLRWRIVIRFVRRPVVIRRLGRQPGEEVTLILVQRRPVLLGLHKRPDFFQPRQGQRHPRKESLAQFPHALRRIALLKLCQPCRRILCRRPVEAAGRGLCRVGLGRFRGLVSGPLDLELAGLCLAEVPIGGVELDAHGFPGIGQRRSLAIAAHELPDQIAALLRGGLALGFQLLGFMGHRLALIRQPVMLHHLRQGIELAGTNLLERRLEGFGPGGGFLDPVGQGHDPRVGQEAQPVGGIFESLFRGLETVGQFVAICAELRH